MTKLKLTYFDFNGGRGEAVRLALVLGNVPFEDDRVSRDQFMALRNELPYGALPVLFVDGKPLAQSNAICRYVGRLANLYPQDPWRAACCDEVLDTVEEMTMVIGATIPLSDEEKKTRREALVAGPIPQFLRGLEARLVSGGADYYTGESLSVADLKSADLVQWLSSGTLDHVPTDVVAKHAPRLVRHKDRVQGHPGIKAYYASKTKG